MEQLESLGLKLVPIKVPEWSIDVSAIGVESAVFFDELVRSGRDKQLTSPGRANGFRSSHLVPAVEYLQSQRARSMMMMKLAEATADVDVYVVPTNSGGGGGGRGRGAAALELRLEKPLVGPRELQRQTALRRRADVDEARAAEGIEA